MQTLTDLFSRLFPGFLRQKLCFIENHDPRKRFSADGFQQRRILGQRPHSAVDHQYRQVGFVQRLVAFLYPQCPQLSLVVNARGVHHHHRPQGQQLHGF